MLFIDDKDSVFCIIVLGACHTIIRPITMCLAVIIIIIVHAFTIALT